MGRDGNRSMCDFTGAWSLKELTRSSLLQAAKLGCTVDTVTLSNEQLILVEERARAAGVAERIRVHLCDYRDLPKDFEHSFDALISTEMIEVGIISGSVDMIQY